MAKKIKLTAQQKRDKVLEELERLVMFFGSGFKSYCGIDQSLTRTGFTCSSQGKKPTTTCIRTEVKGEKKYISISKMVYGKLKKHDIRFAIIEGYAFGAKWGREEAGELAGLIKYFLNKQDIPYLVVAPPSLKKFINVETKENILKEIYKKWKVDLPDNDQADSFVLFKIADTLKNITLKIRDPHAVVYKEIPKICGLTKKEFEVIQTVLIRGVVWK